MFHQSPINYISHVTLRVHDLTKLTEFYQSVLGLTLLSKSENQVILGSKERPLLTLISDKSYQVRKTQRTGLYHVAYLLPSQKDLSLFIHHLIKLKQPFGGSDHFVSQAIYLNDPEGNGIEVYVDNNPNKWLWDNQQVYMSVDPLDYSSLLSLSTDQETYTLPSKTLIGHIHLQVNDLEKAHLFYEKTLGYKVVARYGNQAMFLSDGGYHHHIGINTWQGTHIEPLNDLETGLDSFTISVGDASKINSSSQSTLIDPAGIKIQRI